MTSTPYHIKLAQALDLSVAAHLHPRHQWPVTPSTIWSVYEASTRLIGLFALSAEPQGPTRWPVPYRLDFLTIPTTLQIHCIDYLRALYPRLAFYEHLQLKHPSPVAFAQQVLWRAERHEGIEARLTRGMMIISPKDASPTAPLLMQYGNNGTKKEHSD